MANWWNVKLVKWQAFKISGRNWKEENDKLMKRQVYNIANSQNIKFIKHQIDEIAIKWTGNLTQWQFDEMSNSWNSELMK